MFFITKLNEQNEVIDVIDAGDLARVPFNQPLSASYVIAGYKVPLGHKFEDGNFVAPPRRRWVTVRGFRERMTPAENQRAELFILAASRPDATETQMQIAGSIAALNRMLSDSTYVDLDYPMTRAGVQQLAQIPSFFDDPSRVDEILDGEILPGQYHPDA